MKRWALHTTAIASLTLLLLAGWLWHQSYTYRLEHGFYWKNTIVGVCTESGACHPFIHTNGGQQHFSWLNYSDTGPGDTYYDNYTWRYLDFGFGYIADIISLSVPYWFIVLLTTVLPALSIRSFFQKTNLPSHCEQCGYDLRGSTGQGGCPECWQPFTNI